MFFIADFIEYFFRPKYVIMRGAHIDNRALLFIGSSAIYIREDNIGYVEFRNMNNIFNKPYRYYSSNIYKKIYSRKELKKWRKLLGDRHEAVLEYRCMDWRRL